MEKDSVSEESPPADSMLFPPGEMDTQTEQTDEVPYESQSDEVVEAIGQDMAVINQESPLPADLLLEIIGYVHDTTDRYNMARVSRFWWASLREYVYKHLYLSGIMLLRFVIAVHQEPDLGALVRSITITWEPSFRSRLLRGLPTSVKLMLQHTYDWIHADSPPDTPLEALHTDHQNIPLALLLPFMVNLRSLEISFSQGLHNAIRSAFVRIAAKKELENLGPSLQCLRTCIFRGRSGFTSQTDDTFDILQLPGMRVLVGSQLGDEDPFFMNFLVFSSPEVGTSGITEIRFSNGRAGPRGLSALIMSCANLEAFELQYVDCCTSTEWEFMALPSLLHDAFLTQKHSLQVLRMNDEGYPIRHTSWCDTGDYWMGDLTGFSRLQDIYLPLHNLVRPDGPVADSFRTSLPKSLKRLFVGSVYELNVYSFEANVMSMLAVSPVEFPEWIELVCQFEVKSDDDYGSLLLPPQYGNLIYDSLFEQLGRSCASRCVNLEIDTEPRVKGTCPLHGAFE